MDWKDFNTPDELFEKMSKISKKQLKAPNVKALGPLAALVLIFIALTTVFYTIEPDEMGVIRRFGKFTGTSGPGLHFKLPFGIDKVVPVKVERIFTEEFGFRSVKPGVRTQYSAKRYLDESLMVTGDLNAVNVEWSVLFKVKDPVKLLFNIRNSGKAVRDMSEAVMRQVVGDHTVDEVVTTKRVAINNLVKERLQEILDSYETGILIDAVKLQDVNPPDKVKPAFNEVNEAKQEKERVINQAWEAYNKVIPKARGEAEKSIREAEGYAQAKINRADGDVAAYLAKLIEYEKAKEITLRRMYLETMNDVLPKVKEKYVIDPDMQGLLPLMKIGGGSHE